MLSPESISLAALPSAQVTWWLRHWMELNLTFATTKSDAGTENRAKEDKQGQAQPEPIVLVCEILAHDSQNHFVNQQNIIYYLQSSA